MNCEDIKSHLTEYLLEHELDKSVVAAIEEHLVACASCAVEAGDARRFLYAVRDNAYTIRRIQDMIMAACKRGATHIHFDVTGEGGEIRFRIDGRLRPYAGVPVKKKAVDAEAEAEEDQQPAPVGQIRWRGTRTVYRLGEMIDSGLAEQALARLKYMFNVDPLADTGSGRIILRLEGEEVPVKASFFKTVAGRNAVLSLIEPAEAPALEGLGFSDEELQRVKGILDGPPGLIVLVGDPGPSARTARLAMASYLCADGSRAVYDLEELTVRPVNGIHSMRASGDLARDISLLLSYDPDIISIAKGQDIAGASQAIEFADSGHFVILQMYAETTDLALEALSVSAARCLRMVIRQKSGYGVDGKRAVAVFEIRTADEVIVSLEQSVEQRLQAGLLSPREANRLLGRGLAPNAVSCLDRARTLAAAQGSESFSTEHLLISSLEDTTSKVGRALSSLGLDAKALMAEFASPAPQGAPSPPGAVCASPRVDVVLWQAYELAEQDGSAEVNLGHIVRGLLSAQGGLAASVLQAKGVTWTRLEQALRLVSET